MIYSYIVLLSIIVFYNCVTVANDMDKRCENCKLPKHPQNGKWINDDTKEELQPGTCIKSRTFVTAECENNYTFFGYPTFKTKCLWTNWEHDVYCTDRDEEDYYPYNDCIVPNPPKNGYWVDDANDGILPGMYVEGNTYIYAKCSNRNHTFIKGSPERLCISGAWTDNAVYCDDIYAGDHDLNSCQTPERPKNGKWIENYTKIELTPNRYVIDAVQIVITCNKHFKFFQSDHKRFSTCKKGEWTNDVGELDCLAICPDLYSTAAVKVTCIHKNKVQENCTEALDGTIAELSCKPVFQNVHIWESRNSFRVCLSGKWDNSLLPTCIPKMECGIKAVPLQPLIINGMVAKKYEYPWHIAIYERGKGNKRNVICGGSLINGKLVVTAAHCVTDNNGELKDVKMYDIAAGKYYSNFTDPRDTHAQFSTIKEIFIPTEYGGYAKYFAGDIAILVLNTNINFLNGVLPVCVNYGTENLEEQLLSNTKNMGFVPGFGVTETGNISEVLKEIAVPLIKSQECSKYLPQSFTAYYSYDKFCAGFINQSRSVCVGDSGGGFVIQNQQDGRHYLTGIVSVSPKDMKISNPCDSQQYALYTKVSDHIDFISNAARSFNEINDKDFTLLLGTPSIAECRKYSRKRNTFRKNEFVNYPGQFPFLALIGYENPNNVEWYCRGSLISDKFVMTAAHCTPGERLSSARVRLGFFTYKNSQNLLAEPIDFAITQVFKHPDYKYPRIYNDIALLKLHRKVEFNDYITAACLHSEEPLTASHWVTEIPEWSEKTATIYPINSLSDSCDKKFKSTSTEKLPDGFVKSILICAHVDVFEAVGGRLIPCESLPGGDPLTFIGSEASTRREYFTIAGLSSYSQECYKHDYVVFTKVYPYVAWIESVIWPTTSS